MAAAEQWLSEIDLIIAAHQITRGGDVILYQVENELEYRDPQTTAYMAALEAKVRADGIDVPLTGNHNGVFQGTPGAVQIPGYDQYPLGFNCVDPSGFGTPTATRPTPARRSRSPSSRAAPMTHGEAPARPSWGVRP